MTTARKETKQRPRHDASHRNTSAKHENSCILRKDVGITFTYSNETDKANITNTVLSEYTLSYESQVSRLQTMTKPAYKLDSVIVRTEELSKFKNQFLQRSRAWHTEINTTS